MKQEITWTDETNEFIKIHTINDAEKLIDQILKLYSSEIEHIIQKKQITQKPEDILRNCIIKEIIEYGEIICFSQFIHSIILTPNFYMSYISYADFNKAKSHISKELLQWYFESL